IHRPITVGADMSDAIAVTGSTSSVSIDAGGLLPRHISEPEASVPEAPPIPVSTITMATKHNKEDTLVEGIFWQTEHIAEMPSHEDFAYATEYSPVTVAVSGTLASCAVIDDGLATIRSRSLRHGDTSYYTVSYAVAVENKKGKVFWSDAIEKAPSHSINAIARNIIETMVFDVEDVVTEGIVNITFEIEDDADDIISELYSEGVLALFNE
ncbi:MAG: hypothetical protein HOC94_02460, partial [Waddliaceae bacterium]|nr:hypothetical protein [Waddliaceae bacterium]